MILVFTMITVRLATRKSPLALAQANLVKSALQAHYNDMHIELLPLQTTGDVSLVQPLQSQGGKGLFIKEIEQALLDERADIAVHAMKDMPAEQNPLLVIPAVLAREDARDVFVSPTYNNLLDMPAHALIGTASLRRQSMIRALKKDAKVIPVRGNIETRLSKLDKKSGKKKVDALILAAAGLKRLGLSHHIRHYFSIDQSIPAPGQGIIGIQCRRTDTFIKQRLKKLNHLPAFFSLWTERLVTCQLGGDCYTALGVYALLKNYILDLSACVYSPDGQTCLKTHILKSLPKDRKGMIKTLKHTALAAATSLLAQGAQPFLHPIVSSKGSS